MANMSLNIQTNISTQKPFSESSEQNKHVILDVIQPLFTDHQAVLEIASGTGQHAVHFAHAMPHLIWQPSDLAGNLSGIQEWISDSQLTNIKMPIELNVSETPCPQKMFDVVYTANSFHIMSHQNVTDFFAKVASLVNSKGLITVYGPFNYHGQFTSESNAQFNNWLTQRDPLSGIKDFEWCNQLAENAGLSLAHDVEMPHNNRILCWKKQ